MDHGKVKYLMTAVTLIALAAGSAWAQADSVTLQRALDRPVSMTVADAPIGKVFETLGKISGIRFVIDPDSFACLPYGDQTRLAVTLERVTLRKALTPILSPQALQWEIEGETIRIRPSEALYRMCRRATFEELTLLGKLYTVKLAPTAEGGKVIDQMRKATGVKGLKFLFHVKADPAEAQARADRVLPGTASAWLDMLCHGKGWVWCLSGENIVIVDKLTQVRKQLSQQVTLRYQSTALVDVLLDLARKGRLKLELAPGVMQLLPANTRENFNLIMADASIAQALEVIGGATGLEFIETTEGIRVQASDMLKSRVQAVEKKPRARFFVRMTLPGPHGVDMEVFMRPEELPDDILAEIQKAKERFIAEIRGEIAVEEKP